MKLLVTGGAGFIGSNFIHYWLSTYTNDEVVNLDALTYAGNLENLKEIEKDSRYTFIHGDICNSVLIDDVVKKCDVIVHFAAESHVDRSIIDPSSFVKTNMLGTQVLLESARKQKIQRFHHVSTDEVYGSLALGSSEKFSEQTAYNPHSPYSASKAGSDHLVRAYFDTYHLPVTITNCSNNYGPYQFPEKLFALVITNLLEGKKIPVYTPGNQVRDWLYVEDHMRAIDAVIHHGVVGETYCIGGMTKDVSNLEVIKLILQMMGKNEEMIAFVKDRPGHDVRYAMDWGKIHRELGWEPQVTLEKGLQKTILWYTQHPSWWQDVKSGAYARYYENQYNQRTIAE